jgi:hypothetical membrane protein
MGPPALDTKGSRPYCTEHGPWLGPAPTGAKLGSVLALDWRRAAGFAAVAAPLLMWSEFLTMGISRHGYNLLTRPFSDLATRGTQNAGIFDLGFFIVPGVLTVVIGLGLYAVSGNQFWRIGALMVTASGVFLTAAGVFPQDPNSFVEGLLHGTMAQTCFALASAAPLVLFIGSGNKTPFAPPRRVWLGAGIAAFAIEALAIALRPLASYPDGFFQRPFTLVLTIWFITTGAWLLRGHNLEGLSVPD